MGIIKREPTMKDALRKLDEELGRPEFDGPERYAPSLRPREEPQSPAPLTNVEELAVICRCLTYGEMMTFAEGLLAQGINEGDKPTVPPFIMATAVHNWAKNYPGDKDG